MAKKMGRMEKIVGEAAAAAAAADVDAAGGVRIVFRPLDLSKELHEQGTFDVLLHKLSEDIMMRHSSGASAARLARLERYLERRGGACACMDPVDRVNDVINRVRTLEVLRATHARHSGAGGSGGMPRPPRYTVIEAGTRAGDVGARVAAAGLAYPLICKPIQACGTQGSHTMLVVLDAGSLDAVTVPIVVQEYCNHDARLFKVCVVGDNVQMSERPSLPNLPPGLTGSVFFDSQKPYPTMEDFTRRSAGHTAAATAAAAAAAPSQCSPATAAGLAAEEEHVGTDAAAAAAAPGAAAAAAASIAAAAAAPPQPPAAAAAAAEVAPPPPPQEPRGARPPAAPRLSMAAARAAAAHMRDAFGLSLFGFDLIVERDMGDVVVIDVNYFPSFRDFTEFPAALRGHLRAAAACARSGGSAAAAAAVGDCNGGAADAHDGVDGDGVGSVDSGVADSCACSKEKGGAPQSSCQL